MCDIVHEDLTVLDVPFIQTARAYSVPNISIEVSRQTRCAQPSFDPGIRHMIQYVKKQGPGDMVETSGPHGAYSSHSTGELIDPQTSFKFNATLHRSEPEPQRLAL